MRQRATTVILQDNKALPVRDNKTNKKVVWELFHQYDNIHGIHRKLRCYIEDNGTQHLNYFIAHLSHAIYKRHGIKGHDARQEIKNNLKHLAIKMEGQIAK